MGRSEEMIDTAGVSNLLMECQGRSDFSYVERKPCALCVESDDVIALRDSVSREFLFAMTRVRIGTFSRSRSPHHNSSTTSLGSAFDFGASIGAKQKI
jgi:hypothetical protein